jgi:hypothetical protein
MIGGDTMSRREWTDSGYRESAGMFGVTTVIFGNMTTHDRPGKRIFTITVLIGSGRSLAVLAMMVSPTRLLLSHRHPVLQYGSACRPPRLACAVPARAAAEAGGTAPDFPDGQGGWPLYFAPLAFINNRAFGMRFLIGVILDVGLRLWPATSAFWR